jgi:hypothetical protein
MLNSYDDQPYYLSATATAEIELPNNTSTPTTKSATIDTDNRSIISITLDDTETDILISGYIRVDIQDGTETRIAKKENIFRKIDF